MGETHATIKEIYPELKAFVEKLNLSQGNLNYYASLVKHRSVTKLRRYADGQGLLYLACYPYFRYRETNDNLVEAFIHIVRKHGDAAKSLAKHSIADDLEVIRVKLKSAASLLRYYVDEQVSDHIDDTGYFLSDLPVSASARGQTWGDVR